MKKVIRKLHFTLSIVISISSTLIAQTENKPFETKVESVTLYHSGALVSRNAVTNPEAGVHEITIRNISSQTVLNSLKITNREVTILNKTLLRKLSGEEMQQLIDRKEIITRQIALIESKFKDDSFIKDVTELSQMSSFFSSEILKLRKQLRNADSTLNEAKKLESISLNNDDAAILKILISVESKLTKPMHLEYVCGGIGWSPGYEINVNSSSDKNISVKYLAKAMSQTGEDWNDVIIHLSSSFPLEMPAQLPKPNGPWTLTGNYDRGRPISTSSGYNPENQTVSRLEGIAYHEIRVPAFLEKRTLKGRYSIKSNSSLFIFPILNTELPARYYFFGYPSIDQDVYLVAEITGWDTMGFIDGVANITYNGNDVGKSVLRFSDYTDTLMLAVGRDNKVFMKRSEIADQKYFKQTLTGKKRLMTYAYRIEVKNNNSFPVQFQFAEQVPVSQTKLASVELVKTSGGNVDAENGEITWILNLKPGESAIKEIIYTLEMDGDYRLNLGTMNKKYRVLHCPDF
ncbi:MAG: DUF4139 domain-containing protein [Bacteroidetes bacterium]|nr:DUF4139 domain-containing protein [Bacteroidota bacterium]